MPHSLPKPSIRLLQHTRTPCTKIGSSGFANRANRAHSTFSIPKRSDSRAFWRKSSSSHTLLSSPLIRHAAILEHRMKWSATRSFTQSTQRWGAGAMQNQPVGGMEKIRSPSLMKKAGMKNMDEKMLMEVDLGLLPDTFILPTGKNLPSLWREPKLVWRIYRKWAGQRMKDLTAHIVWTGMTFGYFSPFKGKARRHPSKIVSAAKSLHEDVSMAFSLGDDATLVDICEQTVLRVFQARISRRPADERLEWTRLDYIGKPRVVSFKTGQTQIEVHGEPIVIQQAVVRICSRQLLRQGKLARGGDGGKLGKDEFEQSFGEVAQSIEWQQEKEKEVLEYLVLIRRFVHGVSTDWKIWGFAKEAKLADFKDVEVLDITMDLERKSTKRTPYQPSV